jgi:hypothetical protein
MARKPKNNADKPDRKRAPGSSTTGKVTNVPADQSSWRVKLQQSRIKFDDEQKEICLAELEEHGLKGRAADAAGVSPNTVLNHLDIDPDFAERYEKAIDHYRDKVVNHVGKLALEGTEVRKYDKKGNIIEEKIEYNSQIVLAEAKRVEPAYRDKQTVDLNAGVGGVVVVPAGKTCEEAVAEGERANEEARLKREAEAAKKAK